MRFLIALLLLITMGITAAVAERKAHEADVIVYGGTSAAIAAAVQVSGWESRSSSWGPTNISAD